MPEYSLKYFKRDTQKSKKKYWVLLEINIREDTFFWSYSILSSWKTERQADKQIG